VLYIIGTIIVIINIITISNNIIKNELKKLLRRARYGKEKKF